MPKYVDGFVLPVPKNKISAYKKMAGMGKRIWMKHGALQYFECVGDDLDVKFGLPFPKGIGSKAGETVVFAFIVYKSKSHRDQVNKKVMSDPAMQQAPKAMPFDVNRMLFGGFSAVVEG